MKVLIAIDGSPDSQIALQTARRFLNREDRSVDLLCVAPAYRRGVGRSGYELRILAQTTEILKQALRKAGAEANLHAITAIGSPATVIPKKAEDYDLTVIGPKGTGAGANVGLGPVASRVVEHAAAPVLIARDLRSESGSRILIAVDGSCASQSAIQTLAELFDLRGSEITLLHVRETPWIHLGLQDDWDTYDEEDKERSEAGVFEKEMTREGEAVLEQGRNLLLSSATIATMIEEGNPADEILSEADRGQYDLIVIGASGSDDLKHSILGSVSSKIAWNAPCSVLIVRAPA